MTSLIAFGLHVFSEISWLKLIFLVWILIKWITYTIWHSFNSSKSPTWTARSLITNLLNCWAIWPICTGIKIFWQSRKKSYRIKCVEKKLISIEITWQVIANASHQFWLCTEVFGIWMHAHQAIKVCLWCWWMEITTGLRFRKEKNMSIW